VPIIVIDSSGSRSDRGDHAADRRGRGVDVAIEALGIQATFEACLRVLRPGGTLIEPGRLL
jgi:threonine dehydrogenase-like Zn-dependent dehydrogenase